MLHSYNLGSLSLTTSLWDGAASFIFFLNYTEGGSLRQDDGRRTGGGVEKTEGFSHQNAPFSESADSNVGVVFVPAIMGCVAWLRSVQRSVFKNLQCPKTSHLSIKRCNNI